MKKEKSLSTEKKEKRREKKNVAINQLKKCRRQRRSKARKEEEEAPRREERAIRKILYTEEETWNDKRLSSAAPTDLPFIDIIESREILLIFITNRSRIFRWC